MKDTNSKIIDDIAAKGDGMTVPEGYFEDFAVKMAGRLPFREELDVAESHRKAPRNQRWLRVRPYVYMAAMFAGAWCLIKMFSLMSPAPQEVSISNYPALSLALEDEQFVDEYVIDGVSSYDIIEDYYLNGLEEETPAEDIAISEGNSTETPSYVLPTDGDYSTPPYEQNK